MGIFKIPKSQQEINQFASEQWDKTLSYLHNHFSLTRTDCEDIFQESFIILYNNIVEGKLTEMTSSLSTYFNAICRNKALEFIRQKGSEVNIIDEYPNAFKDEYDEEKIDKILSLEESDSTQIEHRKSAIVRQIVKDLPDPCDKILWGFYRDGFSMKTMSQMLNYASENTMKVTKFRCTDKFKNRYLEMVRQIFD